MSATFMDSRTTALAENILTSLMPSDLTYIKKLDVARGLGYALCAADGTELAVLPTRESAFLTARQNNLEPVSAH